MKKVWIAFFSIFLFLNIWYAERVHSRLENAVIRLHVVANSNTKADQALKLQIRDFVVEKYGSTLSASDKTKAMETIFSKIPAIERDIKQTFHTQVKAELSKCDFPTKRYHGLTFPQGEYMALNIKIGKAEGENWWCVMYPPLCFSDISTETDKEKMKQVLDEESYELVTSNKPQVVYKFKTVELWNKFKKLF